MNSSSGNLALTGDDGVTHTATGDLSTGGSGTVTVVASAGDVTMADGTTYTTAGGTVSVTGASNVALGQIVNASGASNITATAGSITDVTSLDGSGNENISGTTITLARPPALEQQVRPMILILLRLQLWHPIRVPGQFTWRKRMELPLEPHQPLRELSASLQATL